MFKRLNSPLMSEGDVCKTRQLYYRTGTPFTKSAAILAKVRGTVVAFFDPLPGSLESIAVGTHGNPVVKLVVEVDRSLYCMSPELGRVCRLARCSKSADIGGTPAVKPTWWSRQHVTHSGRGKPSLMDLV